MRARIDRCNQSRVYTGENIMFEVMLYVGLYSACVHSHVFCAQTVISTFVVLCLFCLFIYKFSRNKWASFNVSIFVPKFRIMMHAGVPADVYTQHNM